MKKKDEPDFYKLDKTNRLPALQDAPVPGAAAASVVLRQQQQQQQQQQSQQTPSSHVPVVKQHQSPVTTVVTPPSLSPSIMNMTGMSHGDMMRSHNNMGYNMDPVMCHNDGMMGNMGVMGLAGMGQNRLNSDLGPMSSRFSGFNATADAFDLQDEYDFQFGLNGGRFMGNGLGNQSLHTNNDLGFSGLGNGFNNGLLGFGDVSNPGRFGGMHSNPSAMRRSVPSIRQQIPSIDMMANMNDGLGRPNALSNMQDFYPSQFAQQQNFDPHNTFGGLNQMSSQLLNQFQQYQDGSRLSPSIQQLQQVNSMGTSMQMLGRNMGNAAQDDLMSSGMRRSNSRVLGQ
jgi:hypothetical protein